MRIIAITPQAELRRATFGYCSGTVLLEYETGRFFKRNHRRLASCPVGGYWKFSDTGQFSKELNDVMNGINPLLEKGVRFVVDQSEGGDYD